MRDIRAKNAQLLSQQEVDAAETRAMTAAARVRSAAAGVTASEAALRFAHVNLGGKLEQRSVGFEPGLRLPKAE